MGLSRAEPGGERAQHVGGMVVQEQDVRSRVHILAYVHFPSVIFGKLLHQS